VKVDVIFRRTLVLRFRVMIHVVSRRSVMEVARVSFWISRCEVCGGQSGTWDAWFFFLTVSAPPLCSHCYLTLLTEGQACEEHSNTAVLFRMWGNTAEKLFFTFFFVSPQHPEDL
jgi:hypothetical protein